MDTSHLSRWVSAAVSCALVFGLLASAGAASLAAPRGAAPSAFVPPNSSLFFVENVGQFPEDARFLVYRAKQGRLWLTENALWVVVDNGGQGRSAAIRLTFLGANPSTGSGQVPRPRLQPFGLREAVFNYYRGNDPSRWRTRVPVWSGVRYVGITAGVDLVITGEGHDWTWRLTPSLSPSPDAGEGRGGGLRLRVEGAAGATLTETDLRLSTIAGDLTLPLIVSDVPFMGQPAIQSIALQTFTVTSPFVSPATQYATRNTQHAAQASPDDLLYSTFLGGDNDDEAHGLAVNGDGEVYVTGNTYSPGFPITPGAFDPSFDGENEMFVTRLNASGSDPIYSTFLGGTRAISGPPEERAWDIAVDGDNAAHVTGETRTDNFPTTSGAFDPTYDPGYAVPGDPPEANAFYTKLDNAGALTYSTYLGPTSEGKGIAVSRSGMVYVAGRTGSEWFPTTAGAYDRSLAFSGDFFVMKLNPAGQGQNDLLYCTYVGLEAQDWPEDIAVDGSGVAYVIGSTEGAFPTTPGAYDPTFNGTPSTVIRNVVFFKLNPAGNGAADLLYSTYLGGAATINERGLGIAVDAAGKVVLTGETWSADFPTTAGAFDATYNGNGDAFVSKLNPAGNGAADLLYSTYLGGWWIDNCAHAVAVDAAGDIYLVGDTYSDDFPTTPAAYQTALADYTDLFVTRLRPQGHGSADLVYSTFLGGDDMDYGRGIALGQGETVFVTGYTSSLDFPTTAGAYDTTFGGGACGGYPCDDAFVAKLNVKPSYIITGTVVDSEGTPILGVQVSAGGGYLGATNTRGVYTITDLEPGVYLLTPQRNGYFFTPETRTVAIPPSARDQNFVGGHIRKASAIPTGQIVSYGAAITYTVRLAYPNNRQAALYDPAPTHTTYISGSLSAPAGVIYDPATTAVTGTLNLTAGAPVTITFAVQAAITGTAHLAPFITNRACARPVGSGLGDCEWSNQVRNITYARFIYLPLLARHGGP